MEQTNEAIMQAAEEIRSHKRNKKAPVILLILVILLAGAYGALCVWADSLHTFYPHCRINGVKVGGLTEEEACTTLTQALSGRQITLYDETSGQELAVFPLFDLGYTEESFRALPGMWMDDLKQGGRWLQGWTYLTCLLGGAPEMEDWPERDETVTAETFTRLEQQLYEAPVHAAWELRDATLLFTVPRDGRRLTQEVLTPLADVWSYQDTWRFPVTFEILPADTMTAQTLHTLLAGELVNARYDAESDTILPEQPGVSFSAEAAQTLIDSSAPGETVQLAADIQLPSVTAEALKAVLFRDVLGECRTRVTGTRARRTNVALASAAFHNTVLNAGDVFSYNGTVGQRTAEKGYQAAPAYFQGQTVDEIGGGVCQPSSTLYLACLRANLEITERYAHRYTPSYIPWGMDATVSWGGPDYKFTNNTDYPIRILTEYEDGYLTVTLMGTNVTGITAKITNEQLSTTPYEVIYEEDPTLAPGVEKEKVSPYNGAKVKTYRHLYDAEGNLLSSAYEATSNYRVRNQVILRGVTPPPAPTVPEDPDMPAAAPAELPQETSATLPAVPQEPQEPAEPAV